MRIHFSLRGISADLLAVYYPPEQPFCVLTYRVLPGRRVLHNIRVFPHQPQFAQLLTRNFTNLEF